MERPWQQGKLDGLCGIYGIINAIAHIYPDIDHDQAAALFRTLIIDGGDLFPRAVYHGIDFLPLWDMVKRLPDHMPPHRPVTVQRPIRERIDDLDDYMERLHRYTRSGHGACIVGLGRPWQHWTVITRVGPKSVSYCDSYGLRWMKRSSLTLSPGDEFRYRIFPRQTILIERPRPLTRVGAVAAAEAGRRAAL